MGNRNEKEEWEIGPFCLLVMAPLLCKYSLWDNIKDLGAGCGAVIPALWEAEAGGSPEARSSRPTWPTW